EAAVGIPGERTYWAPGGFDNVPAASDSRARAEWVHAVATIKESHVFLDPDTGFYDRHTGGSAKMVLVGELITMLSTREAVIVYRHQYWPKSNDAPREVCSYVWHGLRMLLESGALLVRLSVAGGKFLLCLAKPLRSGAVRNGPPTCDGRVVISNRQSTPRPIRSRESVAGADKGKDCDYYPYRLWRAASR